MLQYEYSSSEFWRRRGQRPTQHSSSEWIIIGYSFTNTSFSNHGWVVGCGFHHHHLSCLCVCVYSSCCCFVKKKEKNLLLLLLLLSFSLPSFEPSTGHVLLPNNTLHYHVWRHRTLTHADVVVVCSKKKKKTGHTPVINPSCDCCCCNNEASNCPSFSSSSSAAASVE